MRFEDLKHRVALQYKTLVADGLGGFTETWTTAATVYAAIWPLSGKEFLNQQQLQTTITTRVRIRFRADIKSDWRIVSGIRIYRILTVINPNEGNEILDLMCEEVMEKNT